MKEARVLDISNDLLFWSGTSSHESFVTYTNTPSNNIEAY